MLQCWNSQGSPACLNVLTFNLSSRINSSIKSIVHYLLELLSANNDSELSKIETLQRKTLTKYIQKDKNK